MLMGKLKWKTKELTNKNSLKSLKVNIGNLK